VSTAPATAAAGPVLRDIHLPPAPGWWPPAPGWWIVALVTGALLAWLIVYLYRKYLQRRYRRTVLRELDACIAGARSDPAALATQLSAFLRRLDKRGGTAASALPGERWLEHLDQRNASDEFTRGIGRVLIEAPFRQAMSYDAPALIALVRRCARRALDGEAGVHA